MEAVLIQQKCEKTLKGEGVLSVTVSRAEKTETVDNARSAIVLCLRDKVLREVVKETNCGIDVVKVRIFVYDKVLTHRQFLKQQLYSFKMVELKAIMEQLTEFNKIIGDLENIEVHLDDAGALVVCCLEMMKVMFLTLRMMPSGAVIIWRDVKHSISSWRGGGKNTRDSLERQR